VPVPLGAAFRKKIAGSKKKRRKFHMFFLQKTYVPNYPTYFLPTRRFSPLTNFAYFVDPLLIRNRPPWC